MFDYVFITHLPAFYKINLYNELSKRLKIYVIFVGSSSKIRTNDFVSGELKFDYCFLSQKDFERKNYFSRLIKLFFVLRRIKYKKIVVGGWDLIEFWFVIFINSIKKNCLALESGVEDSTHTGIKKFIKKIFLSKIGIVFASGKSQKDLLNELEYNRQVYTTKGVGIINKLDFAKKENIFHGNFLYAGRLSEEKNLNILINVFNKLNKFNLSILGSGPQENELKKISNSNIQFIGHIDNKKISEVFLKNDIFILPSLSEPWGLVVEEALYFGLPVIISNKVGCGSDLVKNHENGIIFNVLSNKELEDSIIEISKNYNVYCNKVLEFSINKKDEEQISVYEEALK